jgi:ribosome-binding factor A
MTGRPAERHVSGSSKSSQHRSGGPEQRRLRLGEELRHALARILARARLDDPALADTSHTVTEVRLSPDLKAATVFVVPLGGVGDEGRAHEALAALNRAAGYFRGQLAQEVTLRHCPRLAFAADRSFDQASRVQAILNRPHVRQDLRPGPDAAAEKGAPRDEEA